MTTDAPNDPFREYPAEVREEDRRILRLTRYVDIALALVRSGRLTLEDAYQAVAHAREVAETLFPGSAATFDLIHAPRFRRAIDEVYAVHH